MRFGLLFGAALPAVALLLPGQPSHPLALGSAHPATAVAQVSADPYTNTPAEHAAEVEPDTIAVGHSVMSVFQVGRWDNGCSDDQGWAFSRDGGRDWVHGFMPALTKSSSPPGPFVRVSDPVVGYDAAFGDWVASSLDCNGTSAAPNAPVPSPSVSVSLSRDGTHWSKPVIVAHIKKGQDFDKDWVSCDNNTASQFFGNCYAEWDIDNHGELVEMSTSHDGGRTWSAPVMTASRLHGIGGEPIVLPDGTVVVTIFGPTGLVDYLSTDGGASWGATQPISGLFQQAFPGNLRGAIFQSEGIDASGRIYLTWADCRFRPSCSANDMVMSTSTDGIHWTPVARIPIASLASPMDEVGGGLGVDPLSSGAHARLGLYYDYFTNAACTVATCRLYVGFVSSTDGGAHWSAPQTIAGPMTMHQLASAGGFMVGDYVGAAVIPGGNAFAAFAVGGVPSGTQMLNEGMYDASGGEPITGGSHAASAAGVYPAAPAQLPKVVR